MNQANRALFELHLQQAYADLFANDPAYSYVAKKHTPSSLAYEITLRLARSKADKNGKGVKLACKRLGIKHTYRAIAEYLNAQE